MSISTTKQIEVSTTSDVLGVKPVNQKKTAWEFTFKGSRIFELNASEKGITASAISVPQQNVIGYNWAYIGQIEVDKTKPPLEIVKKQTDSRGTIYIAEYFGKEVYNTVSTNQGYARGGHSHTYDVSFDMPIGSGLWRIFREGKWISEPQKAGQEVSVKSGEAHYIVTLEDTVFKERPINWNGGFNSTNHESRDFVDRLNDLQDELRKLARKT